MGVGGQRHAPAALSQERNRPSIFQEAGWAPGPVRTSAGKSRFHLGVDPRTVQPVASGYTDYTGLWTLCFTINILIMDEAVVLFGVVYYQQQQKKTKLYFGI